MRIRLRHDVTGSFHGIDGGMARGTVIDVDEYDAARYVKTGTAEYVAEESAVLPEQSESATVKRRRVRSKKQPDWHEESAPGWSEGNPKQ